MARKPARSPAPESASPLPFVDRQPSDTYSQRTQAQQTQSLTTTQTSSKKSKNKKSYASDGVQDHDIFLLPASDFQVLGALTVLAAAVRLFRISQPTSVVFDEVHFGGFASKYIKGKFFMDVHPPLAKLLITLAGWAAGFDGEFDFKDIGKDYLEPRVPYVSMRMLPALLGILTIPTMFLTLKGLGCRTFTAAMGAAMLIFENGLVTQSRLILLDSPLVVCTAITALAWTCFTNQHELGPSRAFTPSWWFWLAATGVGLGATASVKWVGLFTIAWVGALTLVQLWVLLGDSQNTTTRKWFKHFFARAFCLIVIPVFFYVGMFGIHFICLVNPGEGDGFMSSEFQATLNNKAMADTPADVALGSEVSLRHWNTQGGYLHSHSHMYPTGSQQQQITLYPHKDENNVWLLENQTQPVTANNETIPGPRAWANMTEYIKDGDVLKLYHVTTHRRLHSHDQRPPVTEADWQQEVTAYGYEGFEGDANDLFRVEIIKHMSDGEIAKERVRTIQTKFKLVHVMTGCVLFSHKVKLPDWGFEQQEVTCAKGGTLPNSVWYIEQNYHSNLDENAEKVNYRNPGFFGKFWELQKVMWTTNAGLVESHAWDSRPQSWPILRRGINFWGKDHRQIYLLGNPVIWWSSTLAIVAYVAFKGLAILRWQRSCNDYSDTTFKRFDYEIGQSVLGWALHYFPFFLMARQLFLHHYFPALYFAIMALCQIYDFGFNRIRSLGLSSNPNIGRGAAIGFVAFAIGVFMLYAPITYGNMWTQDQCRAVKLFDTWDFDCNTFLTSYKEYAELPTAVGGVMPTVPSAAVPSRSENAEAMVSSPARSTQYGGEEDGEDDHEDENENVAPKIIDGEEKVEYRDQDGKLLNDEEVQALKEAGKASFSTKYETKTRLVDEQGNELPEEEQPQSQVAPEHPDTENVDSDTQGVPEASASRAPAEVEVPVEESTESTESQEETGTEAESAQPASEVQEATKS